MTIQQFNIYEGLTSCRLVAESNQSGTYVNGAINNGVGATFTYGTGVLTIDSVTVNVGDRILLAGQTLANQNGIYVCNQAGAIGISAILQRSADFQNIEQLKPGQYTSISEGTVNAGSLWVLNGPLPAQMGISNIVFSSGQALGLGTAAAKAASDNALAVLSSVNVPTIVNHIATYADTNGTLKEDSTTAINGGNIQAGLSGTAGTLASFPATASKGSLVLAGVANTGNTNVIISNALHGQATTYSIADIGGATGNLMGSSTASRIWTGIANISGGSAGPVTLNVPGMPAALSGSFNIKTSTNAVSVQKQDLSVAGQVTVLFSGDPGTGTGYVVVAY